jgi:hypothetical protein
VSVNSVVITWLVLAFALAAPARQGSSHLADSPATPSDAVATGPWGGRHVALEVTEAGATVEYDCAHGEIAERLTVDAAGRFQAKGTHSPEHGGPIRDGETQVRRKASYSGTVKGRQMRLTVTLADPAETLGPFELVQGSEGDLVKCR